MIDRVETLNVINVCSFFKRTSDTSGSIVQSTTKATLRHNALQGLIYCKADLKKIILTLLP